MRPEVADSRAPQDDYYAFVARADRRPFCDVYHWGVRQPLPPIPIPLHCPDADVIVELQTVFAEAFARGGYEERLHYSAAPVLASRRPIANGPRKLPRPRGPATIEAQPSVVS